MWYPAQRGPSNRSCFFLRLSFGGSGLLQQAGAYKDNVDYGAFCGEWCFGRIYETRTGPADLR